MKNSVNRRADERTASVLGGIEKIFQHFSPDTMQTAETSTQEVIVNDEVQKEVINNDSEKSTDISVWKRIRTAYFLYSLYSGTLFWIVLICAIIVVDIPFEAHLTAGIVGLTIVPLCLMGWLRKQCHWIVAVLICSLACLSQCIIIHCLFHYVSGSPLVKGVLGTEWKLFYYLCMFVFPFLLLLSLSSFLRTALLTGAENFLESLKNLLGRKVSSSENIGCFALLFLFFIFFLAVITISLPVFHLREETRGSGPTKLFIGIVLCISFYIVGLVLGLLCFIPCGVILLCGKLCSLWNSRRTPTGTAQ